MSMTALKRHFRKTDTFTRGGRVVLFSRYHCQYPNTAIMRHDTTIKAGIQGVLHPTTLPSVRANMSAIRPTVMSVAPNQSTSATLDFLSRPGEGGGTGIKKYPAMEMMPAMMAVAPKTHFQLAYSAMRPEMRLPKTLPRGAPEA